MMPRPKMPSDDLPKHRRHFGKCSPLDRLPEDVKAEMRTRCQSDVPFREIQAWLFATQHLRTSIAALSDWWRRTQMNGWSAPAKAPAPTSAQTPQAFPINLSFSIEVIAPGAQSISVRILPADNSRA